MNIFITFYLFVGEILLFEIKKPLSKMPKGLDSKFLLKNM
jgi:hypothetical protein